MTTSESNILKARASALAFLSRRDHAEAELRQKLQRKGYADASIDAVIADMHRLGYLDDARFASVYARQRAERGYGPVKIRHELAHKGVSPAVIETALDALGIDFELHCRHVHQRKFGAEPPADLKDKARRQRFLYQRGFEPESIRRAVPDPS